MLELRGQRVNYQRFIDDNRSLNWAEKGENRYKTEGRKLHNAKLSFLIFKNQPTKFDFLTAMVYSRLSDSDNLCGLQFPWTAAHCDQNPFTTEILGVRVPIGKSIVKCKKCTNTYGQMDLHYILKSTALILSASAILHAKKTAILTVSVKIFLIRENKFNLIN